MLYQQKTPRPTYMYCMVVNFFLHSPKKSGCMECDGLYVNVHVFALLRTKPLCGNGERHGVCDGRVAA